MQSKVYAVNTTSMERVLSFTHSTTLPEMHLQMNALRYVAKRIWKYERWYRLDTLFRLVQESLVRKSSKERIHELALDLKNELTLWRDFTKAVCRGQVAKTDLFPKYSQYIPQFKLIFENTEIALTEKDFLPQLSFKSGLSSRQLAAVFPVGTPVALFENLLRACVFAPVADMNFACLMGEQSKKNLVREFVEKINKMLNGFSMIQEEQNEDLLNLFEKNIELVFELFTNYRIALRDFVFASFERELIPGIIFNMKEERGEIPALYLFMYAYQHWSELTKDLSIKS